MNFKLPKSLGQMPSEIEPKAAQNMEDHFKDVNYVNHYVIYSCELEAVIKDEFWRSMNAVAMNVRALVVSSNDNVFLSSLDKYRVYKIGVMNRTTLKYIPLQEPELVFEDLTQFLPGWKERFEDNDFKKSLDRIDLPEEKKEQVLNMYKTMFKEKK